MKKKKGNKLSSNIAKLWKNGFKKTKSIYPIKSQNTPFKIKKTP